MNVGVVGRSVRQVRGGGLRIRKYLTSKSQVFLGMRQPVLTTFQGRQKSNGKSMTRQSSRPEKTTIRPQEEAVYQF